jgi:recombination protein RecA
MAAAQEIEALLAQLGSSGLRIARAPVEVPPSLGLNWPELEAVLPDGGLPRGVVELSAPRALGGSTSVALAAVAAGQARGERAFCAWIDPEATLYAPGVVAAGVDLGRLLVVTPPRARLGHIALKVVASGAFEVVVVDMDPVAGAVSAPQALPIEGHSRKGRSMKGRGWAPELLVRKLALAAEPIGTTVLLLTDASRPRAAAWPVALRLELSRPRIECLSVRVAKDRRGRVGLSKTVPFQPVLRVPGSSRGAELPSNETARWSHGD